MRIDTLNAIHFGPFHHQKLDLNPGINIIYGENETGKTTLHQFIRMMLFGAERLRGKAAKHDTYNRYKPWEDGLGYEGAMTLTHEGESYRLIRNFYKKEEMFRVEQLSTGKEIQLSGGQIDQLIEGLNQTNFKNVLSVGQMETMVDAAFGLTLQAYMANIKRTKNQDIDLQKTLDFLQKEKKSKSESKAEKKLQDLKQQIEELEIRDSDKAQLLQEIEKEKQSLEGVRKQIDQEQSMQKDHFRQEQKERLEAVHLVEENNRIAEAYQKKKAEYARLQEESKQRNFEESEEQLTEAKEQYEDELERFNHMKGRNIAIIFSEVMFAAAALVVFFILKHSLAARAGAVLGLLLIVFLTAWLLHKNRKHFEIQVNKQKAEMDACYAVMKSQMFGGSSKGQLDNLEKEIGELRREYEELQIPLQPYLEKYGEDISLDMDMDLPADRLPQLREEENVRTRNLERLYVQKEVYEMKENERLELQDEIALLQDEIRAGRDEVDLIDECMTMIRELSEEIHSDFGPALNREISRIMAELTDGRYDHIVVDHQLNIKVDLKDRFVESSQLSTGTQEQLYFALRMSMIMLLYPEKNMPVFFDDSFVFYDDRRLAHILDWLSRQGFPQVLIFTCQHREMECLNQMGIVYTKVLLSEE